MFAIGFGIEAVGDQQKYLWKSGKPPKGAINDKGVWVRRPASGTVKRGLKPHPKQHFTRHPNFFGEIFLWWGMYTLCLEPAVSHATGLGARRALYSSVVGPIFITRMFCTVGDP